MNTKEGPFECSRCAFKCQIDYNAWLYHLSLTTHTSRPLTQLHDLPYWVLTDGLDKNVDNMAIITYFQEWGVIKDFYRCNYTQALIQFQATNPVVDLSETQHWIGKKKVQILELRPAFFSQLVERSASISFGELYNYQLSPGDLPIVKENESETNPFNKQWAIKSYAETLNMKLEEQLEEFMSQLLPISAQTQRIGIVEQIHSMVVEKYPLCKVYPYGYDYIGIGVHNDPVRVFIDFGSECSASASNDKVDWLKKTLQKSNMILNLSESSRAIHFPIENISCTIQEDNFETVQVFRMLKHYSSLDLRVRPMLTIIRSWFYFHDVFEREYRDVILALLLITFLAYKKVVPSIAELNKDIEHRNVSNSKSSALFQDESILALSTFALLKEFFAKFAAFDAEKFVICSNYGSFVDKKQFSQTNGEGKGERIPQWTAIYLQSPFAMLNVACNVTDQQIKTFQALCLTGTNSVESVMISSSNVFELFVGASQIDKEQLVNLTTATDDISIVEQTAAVDSKEWERWCKDSSSTNKFGASQTVKPIRMPATFMPKKESNSNREYPQSKIHEVGPQGQQKQETGDKYSSITPKTPNPVPVAIDYIRLDEPSLPVLTGPFYDVNPDEMDAFPPSSPVDNCTLPLEFRIGITNWMTNYFLDGVTPFCQDVNQARRKMQSLYLQFIKLFNAVFWTKCCGFVMDVDAEFPYCYVNYADIDKTYDTVQQRVFKIFSDEPISTNINFRCSCPQIVINSVQSQKHRFGEAMYVRHVGLAAENILKGCCVNTLSDSSLPLIQQLKGKVEIKLNFQGACEPYFPSTIMTIEDVNSDYYQEVAFLAKVYEFVGRRFITLAFKAWLAACYDFDVGQAVNFLQQCGTPNSNSNPPLPPPVPLLQIKTDWPPVAGKRGMDEDNQMFNNARNKQRRGTRGAGRNKRARDDDLLPNANLEPLGPRTSVYHYSN